MTGLYQEGVRFESQPERPQFRLNIFVILQRPPQLKPGILTLSLATTASSDTLCNQLFIVTRTFNATYSELGTVS